MGYAIGAADLCYDHLSADPVISSANPEFNHIPKQVSRYTREDWHAVIDSTWGEGLPTEEKLAFFDTFWHTIDEEYAGFVNLDLDWEAMYTYRDTIAAGVSRGRFYGIMSYMCFRLQETHCMVYDSGIRNDVPEPGLPLFYPNGLANCDHFGACLTPLPDSSLLVYSADDDHPMDLEPGDVVLGYDGIPWKDIYPELIEAQLPWGKYGSGRTGSSVESMKHLLLTSAGMNWHLFDTLDIVRYLSDDTLHLPTSLLADQNLDRWCFDQMATPCDWLGFTQYESVGWGIYQGTSIGYVYALTWSSSYEEIGPEFHQAIRYFMQNVDVSGIIIDFRYQQGGNTPAADAAIAELFNLDQNILGFVERADPGNHEAFAEVDCDRGGQTVYTSSQIYEKPIAILLGPHCGSAGDKNAARLAAHPMARTFGKPTNGAFICMSAHGFPDLPEGWGGNYSNTAAYNRDNPEELLIHRGVPVDEDVWLDRDDVAQGFDTVTERAVEWIQNAVYAHQISIDTTSFQPDTDTLWVSARVENQNDHSVGLEAFFCNIDSSFRDSIELHDDGLHQDGDAGDGLWGGSWLIPAVEDHFIMDLKTSDLTTGTTIQLPSVAAFTTTGPVVVEWSSIEHPSTGPVPGQPVFFYVNLRNEGVISAISDIMVELILPDSNTSHAGYSIDGYPDLEPGTASTGNAYFAMNISADYPGTVISLPYELVVSSQGRDYWHLSSELVVALDDKAGTLPEQFDLEQNYPNPFNPVTTITYALPEASHVNLRVYSINGREVRKLVGDYQHAGYHDIQWDGHDDQGDPVSTGVYLCRLLAGDYSETIKMVYLK